MICVVCKKDSNEFFIKDRKTNRLDTSCKRCRTVSNEVRRQKNIEKDVENKKVYYKNNKEYLYKLSKEWNKNNSELNKSYKKKWKQNNKDKRRADDALRWACKLKATPIWLTKEQKVEIEQFYTDANDLQWLSEEKLHVDHIIPLRGKNVCGLHVPWNLQILTASKNVSKGNRYEFKQI